MSDVQIKEEGNTVLEKRTYSVAEAALIIGISRTLAYDMVREGRLPAITLGSRRRVVPKDALDKWLSDATVLIPRAKVAGD